MMREPGAPSPLASTLAKSRRTLWGLGGFSMFINLLMLTGPLYMLQVYDRVLASNSVPTLVSLTVLIFVLFATLGALDWIRQVLLSVVASRLEHDLADAATSAALTASLVSPGQPTDAPLRDLKTIRQFVSSPALGAMFDVPWTPLFFLALFLLHWLFGVWAIFGCLVIVALAISNHVLTQQRLKKLLETEQKSRGLVLEMTRTVETLDALGMRENVQANWRDLNHAADASKHSSAIVTNSFKSASKASRLFMQSAILGIGAWLAIIGQSTPGAMIAASIIMGRAIAPIEQFIGHWSSFVSVHQSWTNLSAALADAPAIPEENILPAIRGDIEFQNVSGGPPNADKPVLKQVSFKLEAGDTFGIIGPSASGKTTLSKLLVGIWPARIGAVRLDGSEVSAWPRHTLGPQLGYMPQQIDLFDGTVGQNISRFEDDATPEQVLAASEHAGCHAMIQSLPEGYNTQIGQGGAYLSAGQRQRIGLARALYGSPNLVILDEPNSNLDQDGETALQASIQGLKARGATTVIIAHRPNTVVHCNKLLVLVDGEVRMFGPRDSVLADLAANQPISLAARDGGQVNG